jgi:CO/xanthine dehydrogenase Mo-binding subunit
MATRYFGVAMKRREDPRFITGRGTYVDDLTLPGLVLRGDGAQPPRPRPDPGHP